MALTQEQVLDLIYSAKTKEDIQEAYRQIDLWLEHHPSDMEVRGTIEMLVMMEGALATEDNEDGGSLRF